PSVRRRLAGLHRRPRAARARERARPAHDGPVAAPVERRRVVEARLQQSRQADPRGDGAETPGVRRGQGDDQDQAGTHMSKPFAGARILDFTRYLAGPYGTYQLALLGADVVKIESREGDETRSQLISKEWAERKLPPGFMVVNGNKRSITLDLRRPEAVEIVKRLVTGADVGGENVRAGVVGKPGRGYRALSAS